MPVRLGVVLEQALVMSNGTGEGHKGAAGEFGERHRKVRLQREPGQRGLFIDYSILAQLHELGSRLVYRDELGAQAVGQTSIAGLVVRVARGELRQTVGGNGERIARQCQRCPFNDIPVCESIRRKARVCPRTGRVNEHCLTLR